MKDLECLVGIHGWANFSDDTEVTIDKLTEPAIVINGSCAAAAAHIELKPRNAETCSARRPKGDTSGIGHGLEGSIFCCLAQTSASAAVADRELSKPLPPDQDDNVSGLETAFLSYSELPTPKPLTANPQSLFLFPHHILGHFPCGLNGLLDICVGMSQRNSSTPVHHMNAFGEHPDFELNLPLLGIRKFAQSLGRIQYHFILYREMGLEERAHSCDETGDSVSSHRLLNPLSNFLSSCFQEGIDLVGMIFQVMNHR